MAKLNEKQKLFAKEYLIDRNATQAAIRAGYSAKTAGSQGERLLRNVEIEKLIRKNNEKRQKRTEITGDRVVQEIAKVAFADIGLVADWDEEGNLKLKAAEDMCENGKAALSMIQAVDSFDKDGNKLSTRMSFKLNDKLKALELLSKHLGLLDGQGSGSKDKSNVKAGLLEAINRIGIGGRK